MAVNYDAGTSSALAAQYADLRSAIASRDDARNRREARDIESKGLFGTGITQENLQDITRTGLGIAEFGDARMGRKMDRATKSFDRRMKADERRLATLQSRADKSMLGEAGKAEMRGIQLGMKERRDSFEDYMGKYQEKGLWGTSFGGDDVGYRTEGESRYSQALGRDKPGSGSDLSKETGLSENPNERRLQEEIGFSENPNERRGMMNTEGWGQTQGFTKNPEWNQFTNSQRATDEDSSIVPRRHKMMQSSIVPSANW